MNSSFLRGPLPPAVAMIYASDPEEMKRQIGAALQEGCDAFGFGTEKLRREYRTDEILRDIFSRLEGRPFFATAYRTDEDAGMTDAECAAYLLQLQRCGASVLDVMGDLFCPDPTGMTFDPAAAERQKELIARIHGGGSDVILSCHQKTFLGNGEILRRMRAMEERGADICKAVNRADSEAEFRCAVEVTDMLHRELGRPFLYLTMGSWGMPLRLLGPERGSCMYLCAAVPNGFQPSIETVLTLQNRRKSGSK